MGVGARVGVVVPATVPLRVLRRGSIEKPPQMRLAGSPIASSAASRMTLARRCLTSSHCSWRDNCVFLALSGWFRNQDESDTAVDGESRMAKGSGALRLEMCLRRLLLWVVMSS